MSAGGTTSATTIDLDIGVLSGGGGGRDSGGGEVVSEKLVVWCEEKWSELRK